MSWTHSWSSGLQRAWTAPPLCLSSAPHPAGLVGSGQLHSLPAAILGHTCVPTSPIYGGFLCCFTFISGLLASILGLQTGHMMLKLSLSPGFLWFWSFHGSRGFILANGLSWARTRPSPAVLHDRFSFAASLWPKPAPCASTVTQYQVQQPTWEATLDFCGLLVLTLREDFEDFTSVMLISLINQS